MSSIPKTPLADAVHAPLDEAASAHQVPGANAAPTGGSDHRTEMGRLRLTSGRVVRFDTLGPAEELTVFSAGGEVELRVSLTSDGPRLHFKAADLVLDAQGRVEMDCDEFVVRAKRGIHQESGGDLTTRVAGDVRTNVDGDVALEGRVVNVSARRGDVALKANDDVRLDGERVKLNCQS